MNTLLIMLVYWLDLVWGGIWIFTRDLESLHDNGPCRVNRFLIPSITIDAPSVHVAIITGGRRPSFGIGSAYATGAAAIGQAFECIRRGHAQAIFAGGFEAAITPIGVAAFERMRALSHRHDQPGSPRRPFDADRDGFVMTEGGAILFLESLDFALKRGAELFAEVLRYAGTSDAAI